MKESLRWFNIKVRTLKLVRKKERNREWQAETEMTRSYRYQITINLFSRLWWQNLCHIHVNRYGFFRVKPQHINTFIISLLVLSTFQSHNFVLMDCWSVCVCVCKSARLWNEKKAIFICIASVLWKIRIFFSFRSDEKSRSLWLRQHQYQPMPCHNPFFNWCMHSWRWHIISYLTHSIEIQKNSNGWSTSTMILWIKKNSNITQNTMLGHLFYIFFFITDSIRSTNSISSLIKNICLYSRIIILLFVVHFRIYRDHELAQLLLFVCCCFLSFFFLLE